MPAEHDTLASELIRAVEDSGRYFCLAIVGGLGTVLRGRPGFTQDVDALLDMPQVALPGLLEELARKGFQFDMATVIREYIYEHMTAFRFGSVAH